jgi:hypothetical protein
MLTILKRRSMQADYAAGNPTSSGRNISGRSTGGVGGEGGRGASNSSIFASRQGQAGNINRSVYLTRSGISCAGMNSPLYSSNQIMNSCIYYQARSAYSNQAGKTITNPCRNSLITSTHEAYIYLYIHLTKSYIFYLGRNNHIYPRQLIRRQSIPYLQSSQHRHLSNQIRKPNSTVNIEHTAYIQ